MKLEAFSTPEIFTSFVFSCGIVILTLVMLKKSPKKFFNDWFLQKVKEDDDKTIDNGIEEEINLKLLDKEKNQILSSIINDADVQAMELEADDIEILSQAETLDTSDPSAVKKYVNELRQQTYKNKKEMSEVEIQRENEAKFEQLAQIHALLNEQQEKFGDETSFSELQAQMSLYA